ncbi:uncharacterized protein LOC116376449 isoform X1 [Oncorhynchus kisutch]|uniref:uncharacterized protein LOC116376449 isoform X1 n=1 Tax=Oncorhynchus kisutch TaxID=8019 RepID=UPI0012DC777B|nr:uncharacterized protein LOC116376449 isoform X1 [Oncorhynchus kisutch]
MPIDYHTKPPYCVRHRPLGRETERTARLHVMDWWTTLAASIAFLWLLCYIDGKRTWLAEVWELSSSRERCGIGTRTALPPNCGNAVLELRLLLHALTKAACHLYLAVLPLRRAALHLARFVCHLVNHGPTSAGRASPLLLEGVCVICEAVPDLLGAGLSLCAVVCHILQGVLFLLAATVRSVQVSVLAQMDGEKERWEKEQHQARQDERRQNSGVVEYLSVFCQDPISSLRLRVDMINR